MRPIKKLEHSGYGDLRNFLSFKKKKKEKKENKWKKETLITLIALIIEIIQSEIKKPIRNFEGWEGHEVSYKKRV